MKILVCGGRDYKDFDCVYKAMDMMADNHNITLLIHGGARGADELAGKWAKDSGVASKVFPANWKEHGKKAGPLRNIEMLKECPGLVIAFPGGRGTFHMVQISLEAKIPVVRVDSEGECCRL